MGSAAFPQLASDSWLAFPQWLSQHWPWLFLLGGVGLAVFVVTGWDWLLSRRWGQYWPVLAALLPACIPLARSLEQEAPAAVQTLTVMGLLLAVAVLQLYGQQRNNRDRIKTEDRFADLINEIRQTREEARSAATAIGNAVNKQGIAVSRIADGIAALAAQAETEEEAEGEF